MSSWWESHFLLCKGFYAIPYDVQTPLSDLKSSQVPLIGSVEFQHGLFKGIAEQGMSKGHYTRRLSNSRHSLGQLHPKVNYRNNDMGHISIPCNDFKSFYRLCVPDDII